MERFLLEWTEALSVGNAVIDQYHRNLCQLGIEALRILEEDQRDWRKPGEALNAVLWEMGECFLAEEEFLARNRCQRLRKHTKEHTVIGERLSGVLRHSPYNKDELLWVLQDWAGRHVLEMDMPCRGCGITVYHIPNEPRRMCYRGANT